MELSPGLSAGRRALLRMVGTTTPGPLRRRRLPHRAARARQPVGRLGWWLHPVIPRVCSVVWRWMLLGTIVVHRLTGTAAETAELTAKEAAAARKLYVAKCAKCHRFYEPTDYSQAEWSVWMEKMSRKSKLKPEPARLLTRYLDAYRAGELSGKPEEAPKPSPPRRAALGDGS